MSTQPPPPTPNANWFQAPLSADAALLAPLKRMVAEDAVRQGVRALLLRRCLNPAELEALALLTNPLFELTQAFFKIEVALPPILQASRGQTGPLAPPVVKARTGLLSLFAAAPPPPPPPVLRSPLEIAPATMRIMIHAMGQVVISQTELTALTHAQEVSTALGIAIARTLGDELFPPLGPPDPNLHHREVVAAILGAGRLSNDGLGRLNALDRQLIARRLTDRLELMRTVVPPAHAEKLVLVVEKACELFRRVPAASAETITRELRGG